MTRWADRYCDLAGFDPEANDPVFFSNDGSDCTLIRVDGLRNILSDEEATQNFVAQFGEGIGPLLKRQGHSLTISYESSYNTQETVDERFNTLRDRARLKAIDVSAILDENREILSTRMIEEVILIACWTRPDAAFPEEVKRDRVANRQAWGDRIPAAGAMNPYRRLRALDGPHGAFVARVLDALHNAHVQAAVLEPDEAGHRPDLAEIRRGMLFHETPRNWRPQATGDRRYPGANEAPSRDVSALFAPPLSRQIMTSGAKATRDHLQLSMGGRQYAIATMALFPRTMMPFSQLLHTLARHDDQMPFRIAFHIEGGRFTATLKKILAGVIAWASPENRNFFQNIRDIEVLAGRDLETFVKVRCVATTWVEPHEAPERLAMRRSLLVRSMMSWGDPSIADVTVNPLRALAETVAGATQRCVTVPATVAPISELAVAMPFHRVAPVFRSGETLFLTTEGKLAPHEAFSNQQNTWITLIYASPGSGKSVLLNRMNFDFAAFAGGKVLPYIAIIDVGVSSSGLIEVIRNALPPARQLEASYVRLLNTRANAINPLELGFGRRSPLPREKTFIVNFMMNLLRLQREPVANELLSQVITRVYRLKSDLEISSSPNRWQPGLDKILDERGRHHELILNEKTTYWSIVDELTARGDHSAAIRAQRLASPTLDDIARVLAGEDLKKDFGALCDRVRLTVTEAIDVFPIFAHPTQLDLGLARVTSIDLNDVVIRGKSEEAERHNALMYMIARHLFLSKISGRHDEIAQMDLPQDRRIRGAYERYWTHTYDEVQEAPKRLCMDEYHLTGGGSSISAQVASDGREGRKWGLEIILASQLIEDFDNLKDLASTVFILNAENNEVREKAQKIFGFSEAVKHEMERHLHGPRPGKGANFMARYKLSEEERWIVLNNRIGPRLLWALTTKKEDRLVRDALYQRLSVGETLTFLARRFPEATALPYWKRVESQAGEDTTVARVCGELVTEYFRLMEGASPMSSAAE